MKNFMGARQETGFKVSQKKHHRSRKPKFELGKSKRVNDKKKKDKERNRIATSQIAKISLKLEAFSVVLRKHRNANRHLKKLISEMDAYIDDKLSTWDAGGN